MGACVSACGISLYSVSLYVRMSGCKHKVHLSVHLFGALSCSWHYTNLHTCLGHPSIHTSCKDQPNITYDYTYTHDIATDTHAHTRAHMHTQIHVLLALQLLLLVVNRMYIITLLLLLPYYQ